MSASIEDAQAILLAFSKKYPILKTDFFRAGSARLFNRIMNEAHVGKVLFDLVAVRGLETHQLVKAGLLQPYVSPESVAYMAGFKDSRKSGRLLRFLQRDRLQRRTGGARSGAEELGGSARSEMEGQDRSRRGKLLLVWSDDPKMGKGENPTIHAGIGQTGYPASQRTNSDRAIDGRGRIFGGDGPGAPNRKNEGARRAGRMGNDAWIRSPSRSILSASPPRRHIPMPQSCSSTSFCPKTASSSSFRSSARRRDPASILKWKQES